MEYVELLRARRVLTWFSTILFALVCLVLALVSRGGSLSVQMAHDKNPMIPFDTILAGAAFGPLLIASFLGVGLDAEYKTTAIAWTRPLSRLALAARYFAIDFGAMLAAWLIGILAAIAGIVVLGISRYLVASTDALHVALIAFACAVMWYGLIVLVAALLPGRGNAVVGMSWAYALIVPGLAQAPFPNLVHRLFIGLNYVNPLAYLGENWGDPHAVNGPNAIIAGSSSEHVVVAFLIGVVAIALGARIWATREVPA